MAQITYIPGPGPVPPTLPVHTYVEDGTLSVTQEPGEVLHTILESGSIAVNLNPGDIHIGSVTIEDNDSGRQAHVEIPSAGKTDANYVFMVQHLDDQLNVLRESTQRAISDSGTRTVNVLGDIDFNTAAANILLMDAVDSGSRLVGHASSIDAAVATGNVIQSAIMNHQGTLATHVDAQNTLSAIGATNVILTDILNGQGTQAANTATNNILTQIMNGQGTLATAVGQTTTNNSLSSILSTLGAVTAELAVVVNNQGTLATATNQTTGNNTLSSILSTLGAVTAELTVLVNGQGTLATAAGITALNNTVGAGNSIAIAALNGQGTLATHADAVTIDTDVKAVTTAVQTFMYWQQSGSIYSPVMTLLNNQVGVGSSPIADVSGYYLHAIQINITGSAVVQMQSSLDMNVWQTDAVMLHSQLVETEGKFKYVRVRTVNGGGTVSAFAIASR